MTSFFGVPRTSIAWGGKIATRPSSPTVTRGYCSACGAQMFYENDIWPDEIHLYAASLDDPAMFKPTAHFHYAERVPWLTLQDDLPKFPGSSDTTDPD
jgi:hypothetical protein